VTFARLLADIEVRMHRDHERDAEGWLVVTVDDEFSSVVHATGVFETAEAALVESGRRYAADREHAQEGEPGWTHAVVPLFRSDYETGVDKPASP
jgi:hypothetical protein